MLSKPHKLPLKDFLRTFQYAPRLAINLFVTDSQNKILLTKRNISPCIGVWHLPGGFLLKNEPIIDAQSRIALAEFGLKLELKNELPLLGAFEDLDGDPRGHVIDLVYALSINTSSLIKTTRENIAVEFFEKNKLPENIGFNHRETLLRLTHCHSL